MNVLDLFSGIGGFSLGLERAGMRTVAFCEPDEYCRAVLKKHWPDVPIFRDIRKLSGHQLVNECGPIDLVCGGFPCQPFSFAGKQKGTEDDRHLWPYMRQVVEWLRPAWVFGENVTGLIPMALDQVLLDLENLGYATSTIVVPACAVDAHHRRDRVWIVARNANGESQPTGAVDAGEVAELRGSAANSETVQRRSIQRDESDRALQRDEATANSDSSGLKNDSRSSSDAWLTRNGATDGSDWRDGEHAQWSPEPGVGRVADGVPRRVDRLRCLGNAVVPQVVEEIGRAIMRTAVTEEARNT